MSRLLSHTSWLTASRFASQALMVVFTLLLARRLGTAGFGGYAFIAAVVLIGNTLTTFGTDMHLIRRIAGNGDFSALPAALLIQLGLSVLFIGAVLVFAPRLLHQNADTILGLEIYSLALIPLAFFSVFTTALRGKAEMGAYAGLNFLSALVQTALIWSLLAPGGNLVSVASLLVLAQVIVAVLAGGLCALRLPHFWPGWGASLKGVRALAIASAPVALLAGLGILYQRLSLLMLPALGGAVITGWFAAAARAVEAAKLFHIAAFTALYPAMARLPGNDGFSPHGPQNGTKEYPETFRSYQRTLVFLLGAAAGIALGLSLLAGLVVSLLFGKDYAPAVPALRILAWVLVPYTVTTFVSLALLATNRERIVLRGLVAGLVTLTVLNLLLVPLAGLKAASWACLVAELVQAGVLVAHEFPFRLRLSLLRNTPRDLSKPS
jgi:O-antigen/teichoic acid export membrane protein